MGLTVASKTLWGSIFLFYNPMEIWTNWQIGRRGGAKGSVRPLKRSRTSRRGVKWGIGKEREKNQPRAVYALRGADSKGIYCYEIRLFLIVENFKHLDC